MVKQRQNALGFSTKLPNFVENPRQELESEVRAYLVSVNSCTSHCGSSIWLGAFLENRRKSQERRRLTLTCVTALTVMLGKLLRREMGSRHNRDGVKATVRALRVGSSGYSDYIQDCGSAICRRGQPKKRRGDERSRRRLHAGGRAGRIRRVNAA